MEYISVKKRKIETTISDINKKHRHITIYDEIYKEIGEIKYDIYQIKENIKKHILSKQNSNKQNSNKQNSNKQSNSKSTKILYLEKIIKETEIKRDNEISEIKNEIQEIKEMILNIHFQKVNISEDKNNMSYIN
jgi:hypothetical protein